MNGDRRSPVEEGEGDGSTDKRKVVEGCETDKTQRDVESIGKEQLSRGLRKPKRGGKVASASSQRERGVGHNNHC